MGITGFAEGLGDGITSGIKLGDAIVAGRTRRGVMEANKILTELQAMSPFTGNGRGAIDAGGGETSDTPTGYAGIPWADGKERYFSAMERVPDLDTLKFLREQLVEVEKGKILDYGNMGISAFDSGDYDAAQRYFAGMSYFTDPGVVPNIQVRPDGNLTIETDDGMMALTRDDIGDMMRRLTDLPGWQQITLDRNKAAATVAHQNAVRAQTMIRDAADINIAGRKADSAIAANDALITNREASTAGLLGEESRAVLAAPGLRAKTDALTDQYRATADASRAKAAADTSTAKVGLEKAAAEALDGRVEAAEEYFDNLVTNPDALESISSNLPDAGDALPGQPAPSAGTPLGEATAAAEENSRSLNARNQEVREQMQRGQLEFQQILTGEQGEARSAVSMIMASLLAGNLDMVPSQAAYLATQAIMGDNGDGVMDANTNTIILDGNWYELNPAMFGNIQSILGHPQALGDKLAGRAPPTIQPGMPQ